MRKPKLSKILLGIDEVGRGPWAGPLVIGAVILGDARPEWDNLTDSKKLTAKKREKLSPIILEHAAATGLGWVEASEIDRYGLGNSLRLAARRAVKQILNTGVHFDEIIIDGTVNFLADTPLTDRVTILKKADLLIKEVSAASIIAKVARDQYMINLAQKYPNYGFEKHVGYGTALHRQALEAYGPCPEHRRSFRPVQEIATQFDPTVAKANHYSKNSADGDDKQPNSTHTAASNPSKRQSTTTLGQRAEQVILAYLAEQGHQIVAHNFKTKTYEIDLISTFQGQIYFTEVKYRKTATHGSALAQVTAKKHQQMTFAAECFMRSHPEFQNYQPVLAVAMVSGTDFQLQGWWKLLE